MESTNFKELKIIRLLLNEFNSKILYCHWKSNQHFKDALLGIDDLDILIDRAQYNEVIKILANLNFKHFYIPMERSYPGIEDYIGFDNETGNLIHLHLHSMLVIGEKHLKGFMLPIEYYILKNRRWDDTFNCYFTNFNDELLLLILRIGMKVRKRDIFKNLLDKNTKTEFLWLKDYCNNFEDYIKEVDWLPSSIKPWILNIYNQKLNWFYIFRFKLLLYKELSYYSQGSCFYNTFKRNYREIQRIILEINKRYLKKKFAFTRRRLNKGGFIISFVGSDGAGKSSTIKEIYNWLFQFMDVRFFYLGSGDGDCSLLRKPMKYALSFMQKFGFVKKSNNFNDSQLNEKENSKMSLLRKLWVYALSKERKNKLIDMERCKSQGYIVLTDRFLQSEYPGLCDGRRLSGEQGLVSDEEKIAFNIAGMCSPDLVFKMIVPPEVAVLRKPEEIDIDTSRSLTDRIEKLEFSERTKCVSVDSSKEQKEVWLEIKRAIWNFI